MIKETVKAKPDPTTQEEWLKYRKGVRFVMAKLHQENETLQAQNEKMRAEIAKIKAAFK